MWLTADSKVVGTVRLGDKIADIYEKSFLNRTMDMTVMRDTFTPVSAAIEQNWYGSK